MKLYTSQFGDTKALLKTIMSTHLKSNGNWLYLDNMECGDKRAKIGLLLHGT